MKSAIILFSGGLDSTTCLAIAKSEGFVCHALSFRYGQKHSAELEAARRIVARFSAQHIVVDLPVAQFGESALTDSRIDVPDYKGGTSIPVTYVPARNTIFLAFALGWAETLNASDIFIGASAIDYSGYPDCRPEYIAAFQTLANLATKKGVEEGNIRIRAPLISLSKADTVRLGMSLGVDYSETVSCYRATEEGKACGNCDSCALRRKGFAEAGLPDQTCYARK